MRKRSYEGYFPELPSFSTTEGRMGLGLTEEQCDALRGNFLDKNLIENKLLFI